MIADRSDEYALVKRMRDAIAGVAKNITPSTERDYTALYARMLRDGMGPDDANSKSAYYRRRAAVVFVCAKQTRTALQMRDKARPGSSEWHTAMEELSRLAAVFDRYPPDPQKRHVADGVEHGWCDVRQQKETAGWRATSHSKRIGLGALVRRPGWQDAMFANVSPQYRAALAILILTGARPAEIAQGVTVRIEGEHLAIHIQGAKIGEHRGQPERTLLVDRTNTAAQHLAALAVGGSYTVSAHPKRLCDAVRDAGRRAFPRMRISVSPYSLRHAVASALKGAGIDADGIAQVLGHRATRSQQAYGLACHGSTGTLILGVRASLLVRDTKRNPVGVGHQISAPKLG